jgi:hypothetical protein
MEKNICVGVWKFVTEWCLEIRGAAILLSGEGSRVVHLLMVAQRRGSSTAKMSRARRTV